MKITTRCTIGVCLLSLLATAAFAVEPLGEEPWLQAGPYQWGWSFYTSDLTINDSVFPHLMMINYPSETGGPDAAVAAGGPFPIVFFQHAGGDAYDEYDYLFELLATRGIAVVSIDHSDPLFDQCENPCPYWDNHVQLLIESMLLIESWGDDPASPYHQAFDMDRIATAGHSHGAGAAMEAAKQLGPIWPAGPFDVKSMSLIAPCPPGAISMENYPSNYEGLPPHQVVYGSKDRDSCVANGQAIASYEPTTRPRHYAYVVGASHHGFVEGGALNEATIDYTAHRRSLAAATTAWFALTLQDDETALPYLRGDLPLVEGSPEVRYQFHEPDPDVVDDLEGTEPVYGVAIAHVPDHAFVNGFLSDTFVELAEGVQLVRGQIASLLANVGPGPASVLFFEDRLRGDSAYAEALAQESADGTILQPVFTDNGNTFASLLPSAPWDLVVMANQGGSSMSQHAFDGPMRDYLCAGGRAIISDFRDRSETADETLACVQTQVVRVFNWSQLTLSDGSIPPISMTNPGWGIWTYQLETLAEVYATNENVIGAAAAPDVNSRGMAVNESGFAAVVEVEAFDEPRTLYHPTRALELAWDAPGATLRQTLEPAWTAGFDASGYQALSLRVLQLDGDPLNIPGAEIDFHLRLVDRDGTGAEVALSERPNGALSPAVDPAAGFGRKSIFETYRFPLEAVLDAGPELDLSRLESVELRFDITPTGRVLVDDVEFVTRCADELARLADIGDRLRVDLDPSGALRLDWSPYPVGTASRYRVYRAEQLGLLPGEVVAEPVAEQWSTPEAGEIEFFDVRAVADCGAASSESLD